MKIAHVSDLHVTSPNFVEAWGINLLTLLEDIKPDVLLITGDLTNEGYAHEYDIVEQFLGNIKIKSKIIIPGNHDARNSGYKIFEELFATRFPFFRQKNLAILGLDSTEPDIDDGHIGREHYPNIREKLSDKKLVRIMALHHHIIPIPGTGRERNILVDAGDVLKLCMDLELDFVLSGHKHLPWIWKMENTYFITAGTATSQRLKGRSYPSFNVLEIDKKGYCFLEINVANKETRVILKKITKTKDLQEE
jgi:3',5'-cyclic AMP phosphodiesterase CpdA